jgi:hypothetical protein
MRARKAKTDGEAGPLAAQTTARQIRLGLGSLVTFH